MPTVSVFLTIVPLVFLFAILWKEKNEFSSRGQMIAGAAFVTLARLLDIPIEVPALALSGGGGISAPAMNALVTVVSDAADVIGISFWVIGFAKTLHSIRAADRRIRDLEQLLPVCAWCRKIRSADGTWTTLEQYLVQSGGPEVTHGICPDCSASVRDSLRRT